MAVARTIGSIARSIRCEIIRRNSVRRLSSGSGSGSGSRNLGDLVGLECDTLMPYIPTWKEQYDEVVRRGASGLQLPAANGIDYHHWFINLKPLRGRPHPDDFIQYYVDTLSHILPRDVAFKKIYSVAITKGYAFGANIPPEQADKIMKFSNVIDALPDNYLSRPSSQFFPLDPFIEGRVLRHNPNNYPAMPLECLTDEEFKTIITLLPRHPYLYATPGGTIMDYIRTFFSTKVRE